MTSVVSWTQSQRCVWVLVGVLTFVCGCMFVGVGGGGRERSVDVRRGVCVGGGGKGCGYDLE